MMGATRISRYSSGSERDPFNMEPNDHFKSRNQIQNWILFGFESQGQKKCFANIKKPNCLMLIKVQIPNMAVTYAD